MEIFTAVVFILGLILMVIGQLLRVATASVKLAREFRKLNSTPKQIDKSRKPKNKESK